MAYDGYDVSPKNTDAYLKYWHLIGLYSVARKDSYTLNIVFKKLKMPSNKSKEIDISIKFIEKEIKSKWEIRKKQ